MSAVDLRKELKKFNKGWVAIDRSNKVIEKAGTFEEINAKLRNHKDKDSLLLVPASDKYFGFIT